MRYKNVKIRISDQDKARVDLRKLIIPLGLPVVFVPNSCVVGHATVADVAEHFLLCMIDLESFPKDSYFKDEDLGLYIDHYTVDDMGFLNNGTVRYIFIQRGRPRSDLPRLTLVSSEPHRSVRDKNAL